jgi:hypothetical protein
VESAALLAKAPPFSMVDAAFSLAAVVAAIAIPLAHIFSPPLAKVGSAIAKPLAILHRVHSGHIGDYVAFLTFGFSCFGLIVVYCLK